jgi:hypothetical protein
MESAPRSRNRSRRRTWMAGIRIRVLAIALVPSLALLVTGGSVAGYLISEGLSEHSFAGYSASNVDVLMRFEAAIENERTISLQAVGGDAQALAALGGDPDMLARLALASSMLIGVIVGRRIVQIPALASEEAESLIARLAPAVQVILTS